VLIPDDNPVKDRADRQSDASARAPQIGRHLGAGDGKSDAQLELDEWLARLTSLHMSHGYGTMSTMSPTPSPVRSSKLGSGGFNSTELARDFREFLHFVTKEGVLISELVLRALRQGVDVALFHLRAREIFSDPETRRWANESKRSIASGHMPGSTGEELRQVLEERRKHAAG